MQPSTTFAALGAFVTFQPDCQLAHTRKAEGVDGVGAVSAAFDALVLHRQTVRLSACLCGNTSGCAHLCMGVSEEAAERARRSSKAISVRLKTRSELITNII